MERRSVEASAKTVEEAIEKGLAKLGVTSEEAVTEVLNPGSRGLLGIGAEDALVRVSLTTRPAAPAPAPAAEPATELAIEESLGQGSETEFPVSVLRRLLREMGLQAEVVVESPEEADIGENSRVILNVTGKDLGALIGRQGETLRDLQFLTRLIVSRRSGSWPDLMVDVDHYRQRRRQALTQLAIRMADQVREEDRPMPLEPMSAYERRIVHIALREHPHVRTESTGEGERRKVVIWPAS